MDEQDIAAADAILLMEAEEKVRRRIVEAVQDALYAELNVIIKSIAREEAKAIVNTARISALF